MLELEQPMSYCRWKVKVQNILHTYCLKITILLLLFLAVIQNSISLFNGNIVVICILY